MYQYLAFSSISIKEGIAFRVNLFTSLFGGLFRLILLTSIWRAVYIGQGTLAGYNEGEMLFYVVVAAAMNAGGLLTVGTVLGEKNDTGDIIVDLIRPVSMPWRFFFASLGEFGLRFWIKVVPTLLIGLILIRHIPPITWFHFVCFIFLFLGGSFLHYWLNLGFTSFTFKTKSSYGLNILWGSMTSFFAGLVVPVAFYPELLEKIILWTPFPSVAYTPIRILMGSELPVGGLAALYMNLLHLPLVLSLLLEQVSWILIVMPAAYRIYLWNEKTIDVQGG